MNARFVLIFGVSLVLPLSLFQQYDLPDCWYCQARSFAATVNTGFLLFSVRCVAANVVARFLVFARKVFCRHYECQIFVMLIGRIWPVIIIFQQYDLPDVWYCQARSFAATVNTGFLLFSLTCVAANVVARFVVFASKVFCRHYECQICVIFTKIFC